MEKFPEITDTITFPLEIKIYPYFHYHKIAGKAVVPAVESCQVLAADLLKHKPDINIYNIINASFNKLIEIETDQQFIKAFHQLDILDNDSVQSKLITKKKFKKSGITRTIEHVILQFKNENEPLNELSYDAASALDGICFSIPHEKIYKELVTFGPAYRNISETVFLSPEGASTYIVAPEYNDSINPLGSPFVFDAALHVANLWSQRYLKIMVFPVGFGKRLIKKPAVPGGKYFTKVIPVQGKADIPEFDIWIYDMSGNLCEAVFSVIMKEISQNTQTPPDWITMETNNDIS